MTKVFRGLNAKTVVFLVFFFLVIGLTIALGFVSYTVAREKLFETESTGIAELNDVVTASILELWFSPIERILTSISSSRELASFAKNAHEGRETLLADWKQTVSFGSDIFQIYFGAGDGSLVIWPDGEIPEGFDSRTRPWFSGAMNNPSRAIWVKPYKDAITGELVMTVSLALASDATGGFSGVCAMDILVSRLRKLLSSISLPPGGAIHLFHESGIIVLSTEKNPDALAVATRLTGLNMGERRSLTISISGTHVFYDIVPVGETGFFSAVTVPRDSLDRGIIPIRTASGFASVSLGVLVAALLIYLQFYYRKRIIDLASYFTRAGGAGGELAVLYSGTDEFGYLNSEFNRIMQRMRDAELARSVSESKYRNIVENAPVGIYRSSDSGKFESANVRLAEILGYASPEALMSEVTDIGSQLYADPSERGRYLDQLKENGSVTNYVMKNRRKDGSLVWLSLNSSIVPDSEAGGATLFDGFITDVTENVNDKERLRELAETDVLTGVRNRRYFMGMTDRELERQARYGYDVSLLLLDIDHFKHVNDTWGHDGGDKVLVALSRTVETCVRHTDLFARLGGEEFVVLMPETGIEGALTIAERIRKTVEEGLRVQVDTDTVKLTVSIGIATVSGAMTTEDLVKRADSAMYAAKNSGRNRISVFRLPELENRGAIP